EGAVRCLDDVSHQVAARRSASGPEEVRRGRAVAAQRLRGHEAAREDDSTRGQSPHPRSARPTDRVLHRDGKAAGGEEVAGREGEVSGSKEAGTEAMSPVELLPQFDDDLRAFVAGRMRDEAASPPRVNVDFAANQTLSNPLRSDRRMALALAQVIY